MGWNDPESLFGRASGEKGGVVPAHFGFACGQISPRRAFKWFSLRELLESPKVNAKVNAPVNGMFRVAFTFQRAENPHKMRRSSTLAEGKICYRGAIFSLLTGNLCRGGVKAGRDPENPREP